MSDILLERVELSQGRRLRGGLLASAEDLPEGWEHGITFRPIGCSEPELLGPCEVGDTSELRPGDPPEFYPMFIRQSAACALMSQVGTTDIATNRLEATTEWALGRLLATGFDTGNPSFADASVVHTGTDDDVISAVSCLEQTAADFGFGAEVVLHAPLRAAAYLKANYLLENGMSPSGFPWILSPGYPIDAPVGADQTVNIWATGTVWASVSEAYTLTDPTTGNRPVDWRINLDAAYRQRLGLAAFDPCLNLTASFVVPACNGES